MDTLGFTIGKKFTFTKTFAESDVTSLPASSGTSSPPM